MEKIEKSGRLAGTVVFICKSSVGAVPRQLEMFSLGTGPVKACRIGDKLLSSRKLYKKTKRSKHVSE